MACSAMPKPADGFTLPRAWGSGTASPARQGLAAVFGVPGLPPAPVGRRWVPVKGCVCVSRGAGMSGDVHWALPLQHLSRCCSEWLPRH